MAYNATTGQTVANEPTSNAAQPANNPTNTGDWVGATDAQGNYKGGGTGAYAGGVVGQKYVLPAVATANTAQTDLNAKQADFTGQLKGIQDQNAKLQADAQAKSIADAQAKQQQFTQSQQQAELNLKQQAENNKANAVSVAGGGAKPVNTSIPYDQAIQNLNNATFSSPTEKAQVKANLDKMYGVNQTNTPTGNTAPNTAPVDPVQQKLDDTNAQINNAYSDYKTQIDQIRNGTIPLTSDEQAILNSTQNAYDQAKQSQMLANKAYVQATQQSAFRSGQSEYSPEIGAGTIAAAVTFGVQKIAELDGQAAKAISELKQGFMDKDYKMINDSYDKYNNILKDRKSELVKMQDDAYNHAKDAREEVRKQQDQAVSLAGMYETYKQQATAKGKTPMAAGDFVAAQKYKEAYNSAIATERAKLAMTPSITQSQGGPIDSQSILSQTGLSLNAFNFLTQGTAALTRMSGAQRAQYQNEAQNFLNKKGIDISTFKSQYEAYNKTVSDNIMRANQTNIMAGEVAGSADALSKVIDEKDLKGSIFGIGKFKPANILSIASGKEVNDPLTTKYATQLQSMTNDYAGYLAAARGAKSPELQDQKDAAEVISKGLNSGSVNAFKDAITANEEKVAGVVNKAVENSQRQTWGLFGVADKYQPKDTRSPEQINQEVDKKITSSLGTLKTSNPSVYKTISGMYTSIDNNTGKPYTALDIMSAFPEYIK